MRVDEIGQPVASVARMLAVVSSASHSADFTGDSAAAVAGMGSVFVQDLPRCRSEMSATSSMKKGSGCD